MEYGATVGRSVWRGGSRKNAVCVCTLVGKVRFSVRVVGQSASFREVATPECVFPQNALFLTWENVASPHVKAHSGWATSRKSAFCVSPYHLEDRGVWEEEKDQRGPHMPLAGDRLSTTLGIRRPTRTQSRYLP